MKREIKNSINHTTNHKNWVQRNGINSLESLNKCNNNNDNSNKIFYHTYDAFTGHGINLLEETCEEAFKLAANYPQPSKYQPSEKEELIDEATERFGSGIYYELYVDSSEIG